MARRTEKRSLFGLLVALAAVMVLLAAQVKPAVASVDGRYTDGIRDAVRGVLLKSDRSVLAGLIRLLFHDCFVGGCDGSVLLVSKTGQLTERNSSRNDNLRGLELVQQIRNAVGEPISCADAIVFAAREATFVLSGDAKIAYDIDGPGRPDSVKSSKADADAFLPGSTDSFAQLLDNFKKGGRTGFGVKELVVLSSTHGIGVCHKPSFEGRFTEPAGQIAPFYRTVIIAESAPNPNAAFKNNVRDMGALATASGYQGTLVTGDLLDNSYYTAVLQNMNRFKSDWELREGGKEATDLLDRYRKSFDDWKADFITAMTKLSQLKSKGPFEGGVRTDCTRTN